MKRSLLLTLSLYSGLYELVRCAVTIIPSFKAEPKEALDSTRLITCKSPVSSFEACQRRFRSYSDIDFKERAACEKKTKFEDVRYGSFYEFLRYTVIIDDIALIHLLEQTILKKQLNFPLIYFWLMLDKLMREPSIFDSDALIEYVFLVVKLSKASCDSAFYKQAMETLKHAIKSHKPPIILRTLMKFLAPQMTEADSLAIFQFICATMNTNNSKGNFSKDFQVLAVALEELDHLGWFRHIYTNGNDENEFKALIILSAFYFLFLKADSVDIIDPVIEILDTCVFDVNRENMEIISKFLKLTDFCTCFERESEIFKRRAKLFKYALSRFEIEPENFVEQTNLAVERFSLGLVEAFLLYTESLMNNQDLLCISILNAIYASSVEIAVLILTYRPITIDEFAATWRNTPGTIRSKFNSVRVHTIMNLIKLSEEFDHDFSDYKATVNEVGLTVHPFPQPDEYENIAKRFSKLVSADVLNNYFIARIILSRYFGVSFYSSRIKYEYDSSPIWREVASAVNTILFMKKSQHRVHYVEPGKERTFY